MESTLTRRALAVWTFFVVLFLHLPIVVIILYAFDRETAQGWPITEWTTKWFGPTIHDQELQAAVWLSLKAATAATLIALLLGSAAAFAVHRFRFFGREVIAFLFVLPIALPGIITGMALNSFFTFWKFNFGLWTIVVGHATFCVVIVTTFTAGIQNTLPIWIFGNIRLGQQLPEVNVVVLLVLIATIVPVWISQRLTSESGILRQQ